MTIPVLVNVLLQLIAFAVAWGFLLNMVRTNKESIIETKTQVRQIEQTQREMAQALTKNSVELENLIKGQDRNYEELKSISQKLEKQP